MSLVKDRRDLMRRAFLVLMTLSGLAATGFLVNQLEIVELWNDDFDAQAMVCIAKAADYRDIETPLDGRSLTIRGELEVIRRYYHDSWNPAAGVDLTDTSEVEGLGFWLIGGKDQWSLSVETKRFGSETDFRKTGARYDYRGRLPFEVDWNAESRGFSVMLNGESVYVAENPHFEPTQMRLLCSNATSHFYDLEYIWY